MKVFLIFFLFLALTGCNSNINAPIENSSFPETSSIVEDDGYLGEIDGYEIYQKSFNAKHTHPQIEVGYYGELNTLKAESESGCDYLITDVDGNLLINQPFCRIYYSDPRSALLGFPSDKYYIAGIYEGSYYLYCFENGEFVLDSCEKSTDAQNSEFGYKRTKYYYVDYGWCYGLSDEYGNVIFEPIHDVLGIPFDDRFLLSSGNKDPTDPSSGMVTLVDITGKCYAKFNYAHFYVFDDGSYIGIARNFEDACSWDKCYDGDGSAWDYGLWFIDKNGNKLSPSYEKLVSVKDRFNNIIESPDDIITAIDENGNTVEFTARDYLCYE